MAFSYPNKNVIKTAAPTATTLEASFFFHIHPQQILLIRVSLYPTKAWSSSRTNDATGINKEDKISSDLLTPFLSRSHHFTKMKPVHIQAFSCHFWKCFVERVKTAGKKWFNVMFFFLKRSLLVSPESALYSLNTTEPLLYFKKKRKAPMNLCCCALEGVWELSAACGAETLPRPA